MGLDSDEHGCYCDFLEYFLCEWSQALQRQDIAAEVVLRYEYDFTVKAVMISELIPPDDIGFRCQSSVHVRSHCNRTRCNKEAHDIHPIFLTTCKLFERDGSSSFHIHHTPQFAIELAAQPMHSQRGFHSMSWLILQWVEDKVCINFYDDMKFSCNIDKCYIN